MAARERRGRAVRRADPAAATADRGALGAPRRRLAPQGNRAPAGESRTGLPRDLREPDPLAEDPGRPPPGPPLHARLHRRPPDGLRRAPRRPEVRRRPRDRGGTRALPQPPGRGRRASEGARHEGESPAKFRHAAPGGLPKGPAGDAPRGQVRPADPLVRRYGGRLPRDRRGGARPGGGDRGQPPRDGRIPGADHRRRHGRGGIGGSARARRRRPRPHDGARDVLRHLSRGLRGDPLEGRLAEEGGGGSAPTDRGGPEGLRRDRRDHPRASRRGARGSGGFGRGGGRGGRAPPAGGCRPDVGGAPREAIPEVPRDGPARGGSPGVGSAGHRLSDAPGQTAAMEATLTRARSPEGRASGLPAPADAVSALAHEAGVPPVIARLLLSRGIGSAAEADLFFRPDESHLYDPFRLAGVGEAAERLVSAARSGRRIVVFGDYDVDGVTAVAQLKAALTRAGAAPIAFIPHRLKDGYGFTPETVRRVIGELAPSVIVTVDCGITAVEGVACAREAGVDVIVTDHHVVPDRVPEGVVIVNPRMPGSAYPCADLSGSGVAFKLAQAIARTAGVSLSTDSLLRAACLGRIADVVPLTGENRTIAALGLAALARPRAPGL